MLATCGEGGGPLSAFSGGPLEHGRRSLPARPRWNRPNRPSLFGGLSGARQAATLDRRQKTIVCPTGYRRDTHSCVARVRAPHWVSSTKTKSVGFCQVPLKSLSTGLAALLRHRLAQGARLPPRETETYLSECWQVARRAQQ